MSKSYKWLGGSLGWLVGGPVGGFLGFVAGNMMEEEPEAEAANPNENVSELEACWMVIASHIIQADGKVSLSELDAVRKFVQTVSGEEHIEDKMKVLNHCLSHHYELEKACGYIRIYHHEDVAHQTLRFAYEVAVSDSNSLAESEKKALFKIAGLLNINDVVYRKLIASWSEILVDDFSVFDLKSNATQVEVRMAYRKLVLKIHPDRNAHYTTEEVKQAEMRLQQLREAYERLTEKFKSQ